MQSGQSEERSSDLSAVSTDLIDTALLKVDTSSVSMTVLFIAAVLLSGSLTLTGT